MCMIIRRYKLNSSIISTFPAIFALVISVPSKSLTMQWLLLLQVIDSSISTTSQYPTASSTCLHDQSSSQLSSQSTAHKTANMQSYRVLWFASTAINCPYFFTLQLQPLPIVVWLPRLSFGLSAYIRPSSDPSANISTYLSEISSPSSYCSHTVLLGINTAFYTCSTTLNFRVTIHSKIYRILITWSSWT